MNTKLIRTVIDFLRQWFIIWMYVAHFKFNGKSNRSTIDKGITAEPLAQWTRSKITKYKFPLTGYAIREANQLAWR